MFNRLEKNTEKEYLYDLYLKNNGYSPIVSQYAISNIRKIDGTFEVYMKREREGYRRRILTNGNAVEVLNSTSTVLKQEGAWRLHTEYAMKVNGEVVYGNKTVNYKGRPIDVILRVGNIKLAAFISEFTPLIVNRHNKKA